MTIFIDSWKMAVAVAGDTKMDHLSAIERDRAHLSRILANLIRPGQRYAFLDFPDYGNVGDTAIALGSLKLLREVVGRGPDYLTIIRDFDAAELQRRIGNGPIILQGGGNFGDIYPWFQSFRERVVRQHPNNRIIQMPQSIHYRDPAKATEAQAAIARHSDFHLLVRDKNSLSFALANLHDNVTLSPDGAFGLGPLARSRVAEHDVVFLLRDDDEIVERDISAFESFPDAPREDWITDPPAENNRLDAALRAVRTLAITRRARSMAHYQARAHQRLARGVRYLSSGHTVCTDRLHAHILSLLLGIPHVALDNDYGKVHSYMDAFSGVYEGAFKAVTAAEAADLLRKLECKGSRT